MYELIRAGVVLAILWVLWQIAIGPDEDCAEWSFECPAPAVAVDGDPDYTG